MPPKIKIAQILSNNIDIWYGVTVYFNWKVGFNFKMGDELDLANEVAKQIVQSEEWQEFFKSHHKVLYENMEKREVSIPEFLVNDFNDWSFNRNGGWIGTKMRSEN